MARPFRFAVQKRNFDDPDEIAEFARHVEALGYDELYSYDHVGAVDPFVPLLPAALATERLKVGPLVLNNELHHPALVARTAATLDRMTGGRLVLGIGTGYSEAEHRMLGLELRAPAPRVDRFGESVAIVRALLDHGAVDHHGEHLTVTIDDLGVRPTADRLPILVGGFGRRVLGIAAQFADIVQFTGLGSGDGGRITADGFAIETVVERADWLTEAAADRNGEIERSALVQMVAVGDDAPSDPDLASRFETAEGVVAESPFVLAGSVERIIDKLERIRERTGISHYVVRDPDAFSPIRDALHGR